MKCPKCGHSSFFDFAICKKCGCNVVEFGQETKRLNESIIEKEIPISKSTDMHSDSNPAKLTDVSEEVVKENSNNSSMLIQNEIVFRVKAIQGGFRDYTKDGWSCRAYEFSILDNDLGEMKKKILSSLISLPTFNEADFAIINSSLSPVFFNSAEEASDQLINFINVDLTSPGDFRRSINELFFICEIIKNKSPYSLKLTVLRKYYDGGMGCTFHFVIRSENNKYKISTY